MAMFNSGYVSLPEGNTMESCLVHSKMAEIYGFLLKKGMPGEISKHNRGMIFAGNQMWQPETFPYKWMCFQVYKGNMFSSKPLV